MPERANIQFKAKEGKRTQEYDWKIASVNQDSGYRCDHKGFCNGLYTQIKASAIYQQRNKHNCVAILYKREYMTLIPDPFHELIFPSGRYLQEYPVLHFHFSAAAFVVFFYFIQVDKVRMM